MGEIALNPTAQARAPRAGFGPRLARAWHQLLLGIAEGFTAAQRYRRLAALSDAALAQRGLMREDLPSVAVFGERRPR
jgi:hypothetical protein